MQPNCTMKHLKTFEDFSIKDSELSSVNEGLSKGDKPNKKDHKTLLALAKEENNYDFIEEFAQVYNCAAEMWMGEKDIMELKKKYASEEYEFITLSGTSEDGSEDSKMEDHLKKGWKLLADEQNGDSYDAVLYKKI